MKCYLCQANITKMEYAIRDMVPEETYKQWVIRHIKSFLYYGFAGRKFATIMPICTSCIIKIRYKNL